VLVLGLFSVSVAADLLYCVLRCVTVPVKLF
jgi:hypothetical protein